MRNENFDEATWSVFAAAALAANNHGTAESMAQRAAGIADAMMVELEKRVSPPVPAPEHTPAESAPAVDDPFGDPELGSAVHASPEPRIIGDRPTSPIG